MLNCETCRGQLLEYLYDLVDGVEHQGIQDHLDGCAACQDALAKAQAQKQLFGKAAKAQFPGVRFDAPAAAAVLPLSTPVPRRTVKRAWMARVATSALARAAAVLLLMGGLAIPVGLGGRTYM